MKKVYKKPTIVVEQFNLTQSVAQTCGYQDDKYIGKPNTSEKGQCGWDMSDAVPGLAYWTGQESKCSGNYSPDLGGAEVCYDAPAGVPTIFAS